MHDCQKNEARVIDLLFGEATEVERRQLLAEVEGCDHCRGEYQAFASTLSAVDQASAAMQPEEGYWNGYEARLRAKLAADQPQAWWRRWRNGWQGVTLKPMWAMSTAVLLALALLLWALLARVNHQPGPPQQANIPPVAQPEDHQREDPKRDGIARDSDPEKSPDQQRLPAAKPKQTGPDQAKERQRLAIRQDRPAMRPQELKKILLEQPSRVATNVEPASGNSAPVDNDTLKHFEKAQLFLRSFRNLQAGEAAPAFELADEKQRARALLFKNVLLRREAEAKGNLPFEQVLSDLEPLLLDIANLSDTTTAEEIRTIHGRLQKREMIATLQVYAARPIIARAVLD
jgi:hypothetical protein